MRVLLVPPLEFVTAEIPNLLRRDIEWAWFINFSTEESKLDLSQRDYFGAHLKSAFARAIQEHFDIVVYWRSSLYPSGEAVNTLVTALEHDPAAASVFLRTDSLRWSTGTQWIWNRLMSLISGSSFRGWAADVRAYRTHALRGIAFELNTHEPHFEVEVILELLDKNEILISIPSPTARAVKGFRGRWEALLSLKAALKYRLQMVNLFYDFRFHPEQVIGWEYSSKAKRGGHYRPKFLSDSPHRRVCDDPAIIKSGSTVLDLGCASGYVARRLAKEKGCRVIGVDCLAPQEVDPDGFEYHQMDLEKEAARLETIIEKEKPDVILLLDVLEHLAVPEQLMLRLYRMEATRGTVFVVSTANVAFIVIRLMLLMGHFNYGNRGILDVTHKRLFSMRTFRNLLNQTGFMGRRRILFPVPYAELGFSPRVCWGLEKVNQFLLRIFPSFFAYQILWVAESTKRFPHGVQALRASATSEAVALKRS